MGYVPALLSLAFMIGPVAALLFAVRLIVALFSPKVSGQIRQHPVTHVIWGCLALVGVLVFLGVLDPAMWPPRSVERRAQRAKAVGRIQSAGGWTALQKDCDALAEHYRDSVFQWHRGFSTNALPPAIAALTPKEVIFYSAKVLREFRDEPQVPVVRIKVFGIHSTGGHSIPYFGFEVVCTTNAESYRPQPSRGGVSGNHYGSYRQVTDRIYEIY
jgi:hypothetical protein